MGKIIPIISQHHEAAACTYKPGQKRRVFTIQIPEHANPVDNTEFKRALTLQGFENPNIERTMVGMDCPTCNACVPLRIPAPDFVLSANQRRLDKRNVMLASEIKRMRCGPTDEHYELYRAFYESRIKNRGIEDAVVDANIFHVTTSARSHMQIIRAPLSGKLLSALYYDDYGDSLYAASQIYDPEYAPEKSLGRYGLMKLVEYAHQRGDIRHVYLGSWVKGSKAVDYKKDFHPLEAMTDQGWVKFDPDKHVAGPTLQLPTRPSLNLD